MGVGLLLMMLAVIVIVVAIATIAIIKDIRARRTPSGFPVITSASSPSAQSSESKRAKS